ncbi:family 16 glycosylhydrolase [Paraferrimonas sp. SM1919]|uniref:family 16 glycosylhydrolase n=1 Tax=Paraferrimonas sp. SM1919 TaxID=2662263 RepID=UPI0013D882DE|nr:family 16 glycosylhydrolase [Paraferrimonas sp. SM1919]
MATTNNSPIQVMLLPLAIGLFTNSHSALAQQCQLPMWEDNFDASSLNTNAWDIQLGDGCDQGPGMCGWGNDELQNYQADNITLNNGVMTIEARKQRIKGTQYTSARIRTANMPESGEWAFGRFEARLKFPDGQGMWPAFWMLPSNAAEGWPISGEIDIFESVGQSANNAYGTIHYGQPWPDNSHMGAGILKQPGKWSDNFHTYAIEWQADEIRWYLDNMLYSSIRAEDVQPEDWPFDGRNNFHFILNLAVGGSWGGTVDDSVLPQQLLVDYVRVYAGSQPNLSGNHLPAPGSTENYSVINSAGNTTWSVTGGTISGSGDNIQVTWDPQSAATTQSLTVTSGGCEVSTPIYVGKALSTETVLDDFNGSSAMGLTSATGNYNVNAGVLDYRRDSASQYDVIAYSTNAITDGNAFIVGDKAFEVDVNNTDPNLIGKEILIQLEDSSVATPSNYPSGRHSKYQAFIEHANGWQTLRFMTLERIDGATADNSIDAFLFLIDPNSFNGDSYTLDNVVILGEAGGANTPPSAAFNYACNDLSCNFDGSASSDSDGSISSYQWDFGDGNSSNGVSTSHTFSASGDYSVTLTVTDDLAAQATSTQTLSVSQGSEEATSLVVSSITTGTQSAGRGQKYGTATVTITDNLGTAAAGVTVNGRFSGSWNESVSGLTASDGTVTLKTTSALGGNVEVNFCVDTVSGALPMDSVNSQGLCQ